jgi:hypothetical protein
MVFQSAFTVDGGPRGFLLRVEVVAYFRSPQRHPGGFRYSYRRRDVLTAPR